MESRKFLFLFYYNLKNIIKRNLKKGTYTISCTSKKDDTKSESFIRDDNRW